MTPDLQEAIHQYRHLLDGAREVLVSVIKTMPELDEQDPDSYWLGALLVQTSDLGALVTKHQEWWGNAQ